MAPHLAMGNPFSHSCPEEHVTSHASSNGLIGNTQAMPNQQPINDALQLPTHFQHFVQRDGATSNPNHLMQLNVGGQMKWNLNTEPCERQDLPLFNGSDESNIADQPAYKTAISQPNLAALSQPHLANDNLFRGKSDFGNSNQDAFQPTTNPHDLKLETAQSGLKLSNAEFKSDRDIPRVYSVDELEKGFFSSNVPYTKSISLMDGDLLSETEGIRAFR